MKMMQENKNTNIPMPAGHMKRYHPHGIKEDSTCKYLKPESSSTPKTSEVEKARDYLTSQGIRCEHVTKDSELFYVCGPDVWSAAAFKVFGRPVSKQIYEKNLIAFSKVYKEIKEKHPTMPFGSILFIPWDEYDTKKYFASSTVDKRKGVVTRYISLGNLEKSNIDPEHIIRHEMGHSLATYEVFITFARLIPKKGSPAWNKFEKDILGVSKKAGEHHEEAIAEIFAKYTAPDYKQGTMPVEFENLAKLMLGERKYSEKGLTMDEGISDKDFLKIPMEYRVMFDPTKIPPKDEIRWYDNKVNKFLKFNTHEDMARYVLSLYQMKNSDIEKLIRANPDRQWDTWDLGLIAAYWMYGDMSIDDIIEKI